MRLVNKRPPRRRRSQSRLGIKEAVAPAPRLSLLPVQISWQDKTWRVPAVILAALLCYALFYCFTDEQFFIFGAAITGNSRLSAQRIFDQAGIEGQSIFFLNAEDVRKRVEGLPNIKASSVSLQLPASVEIQVQEREPSFTWQVGQKTYWVDEEGMVMEPAGLPPHSVTLIDMANQVSGPGVRIAPQVMQVIGELRRWLPQEKIFQWSQTEGISFLHVKGFPVYLGQAEDMQDKIAALRALTEDFTSKGIQPKFVDLRFAGRPYYR
jgi:cell division septal protein FtsQ